MCPGSPSLARDARGRVFRFIRRFDTSKRRSSMRKIAVADPIPACFPLFVCALGIR